jgi:hypothetical protein
VIGSPGRIVKPAAEIACRITPGYRPYPWAKDQT